MNLSGGNPPLKQNLRAWCTKEFSDLAGSDLSDLEIRFMASKYVDLFIRKQECNHTPSLKLV